LAHPGALRLAESYLDKPGLEAVASRAVAKIRKLLKNQRQTIMSESVIRLGIIGMGLNNMASTFGLLTHEPDLRYKLQALCTRREDHLEQCYQDFFHATGFPVYALAS